MQNKWIIPAALAVVLVVGLGMSRPSVAQANGFLSHLSVGMAVSVTQDEGEPAYVYIPTSEEAATGDFWTVTELGSDFFQCKTGTAVWRVPLHSIGRISWNEDG